MPSRCRLCDGSREYFALPPTTISSMSFAPQQNWSLFESQCRAARISRLRNSSTDDDWAMYLSMFDLVVSQSEPVPSRVSAVHWNEKLAIRQKLAAVFSKLDEMNRGRGPANNTD